MSQLAGVRERLLALRSLETLVGLDDEALTLLAEHTHQREFRKGDVLTAAHGPPDALHVIVDGRVNVMRDGDDALVGGNGDRLGVLALMAGFPVGNVTAIADTRTLEISVAAWKGVMEDNFSLLRNELRLLSMGVLSARGVLPVSPPSAVLGDGTGEYPARSLTVVERVMRLRDGVFGVMSVDALSELARRMVEVRIPAGELIWSVGDRPAYTLHLHHGRVRCTAADGGNVDAESPTMLGELEEWSTGMRSYELRALTDVVAWRVAVEDVLMVLESHIQPAIQMLANVGRMLLSDPATAHVALGVHRAESMSTR